MIEPDTIAPTVDQEIAAFDENYEVSPALAASGLGIALYPLLS